MKNPDKPTKLLMLAADAATVCRNRLADAGMAAIGLGQHELDEAIRNLWNDQLKIQQAIERLQDEEPAFNPAEPNPAE